MRGFSGRLEEDEAQVRWEPSPALRISSSHFDVGESGTLLRFLIPVCTVLPGPEELRLRGRGSLKTRSNREVLESVRSNDLEVRGTGEDETVPVICRPGQSLPSSPVRVAASSTSQLLSGWLLALSGAGGGRLRLTTSLVSAPYVTMTERVLKRAGVEVRRPAEDRFRVRTDEVRPLDYEVPGDYSSAAFFMVGAALTPGTLRLRGLVEDDVQADRRIVSILGDLGVQAGWEADGAGGCTHLRVEGPARPDGFEVDASDCPDLVPILSVLGCFAEGPVRLTNIAHLTNKESDRIRRTAGELRKLGMRVETSGSRLVLDPGGGFRSGAVTLDAHNDHRLAMSFSILGAVRGDVRVSGIECVAKSYPDFYEDLEKLGVAFTRNKDD